MTYAGDAYHGNADARDLAMMDRRAAALNLIPGPRVGDFIDYADGIVRRMAHVWPADWHDDGIARVQVTDGGSFYLGGAEEKHSELHDGEGYVSYSGSLFPGIKADTLKLAGSRNGRIWIFHHEQWGAGMGVDGEIAFRVYDCSLNGRDPYASDR